ncbi:iron-containing alcohol dehydrogenase [Rhodococcus erythropolis]|nr:iron-containing alcohol dehydrogenase [Rhodococcus erythropolis]
MPREFAMPTTNSIVYGKDALGALPDVVARKGASKALVMMSGSLAGSSVEQELREHLGNTVAEVFSATPQHVPREAVLAAADIARSHNVDCVISVGGGTQIDAAKAVAMCLAADVTDDAGFDRHRIRFTYPNTFVVPQVPGAVVPHFAIPTTLSGAENTDLVGITDMRTREKHTYRSPLLAPAAVVLDPAMTTTTPDWLWGASGIRAVDHAVESILSAGSTPVSDALCTEALELLNTNLAHSVRNPRDTDARLQCLLGAWLASFAITNSGVGLSHAIGHQLAAEFDITHGVTSAIMLPHVIAFNARSIQEKAQRIASAFGRTIHPGTTAADAARDAVRELVANVGVPATISGAGGRRDALPAIAAHVMLDHTISANPRPITESDILRLLEAAW